MNLRIIVTLRFKEEVRGIIVANMLDGEIQRKLFRETRKSQNGKILAMNKEMR